MKRKRNLIHIILTLLVKVYLKHVPFKHLLRDNLFLLSDLKYVVLPISNSLIRFWLMFMLTLTCIPGFARDTELLDSDKCNQHVTVFQHIKYCLLHCPSAVWLPGWVTAFHHGFIPYIRKVYVVLFSVIWPDQCDILVDLECLQSSLPLYPFV